MTLKGEGEGLKFLRSCGDLDLEPHLGVVEQPVLRVEGDMVLSLNEADAGVDVELVLEVTG